METAFGQLLLSKEVSFQTSVISRLYCKAIYAKWTIRVSGKVI